MFHSRVYSISSGSKPAASASSTARSIAFSCCVKVISTDIDYLIAAVVLPVVDFSVVASLAAIQASVVASSLNASLIAHTFLFLLWAKR